MRVAFYEDTGDATLREIDETYPEIRVLERHDVRYTPEQAIQAGFPYRAYTIRFRPDHQPFYQFVRSGP